jgi:hypothetical protein
LNSLSFALWRAVNAERLNPMRHSFVSDATPLPETRGAKGREVWIGRNQHKPIYRRLGSEDAIERIAMCRTDEAGSPHMRDPDWQDLEPCIVHVAFEIEEQITSLGPFAKTNLDCNLPRIRHADENVVLFRFQRCSRGPR